MTVVSFLTVHFVLGFVVNIANLYVEWRKGNDFTTKDIPFFLMCVALWPFVYSLVGAVMACEAIHQWLQKRNNVLIPGSKSAKMERFLRGDDLDKNTNS